MTRTKKIPRKISKKYLENAALYYLQRYATSAANLRRVMMRKIDKSCRHHQQDAAAFTPLLDDMIMRYVSAGLLNDASYAQAKTATLRRQGKSRQMIQAKLQVKGLAKQDIADALSKTDESADAEFDAALKLAKKKKLGPFRAQPPPDREALQKEMAVLGRAGFSYETARRALDWKEDAE